MQFKNYLAILAITSFLTGWTPLQAEVKQSSRNPANPIFLVSDEAWQPKDFENGTVIPASYLHRANIDIDGRAEEPAWQQAKEIEIPLSYGNVKSASLKAVYTDQEVFIRVRWADDDEDRQYRPWIWNSEQKKYIEGSQLEDSVLLSFEAGCEWTPSMLGGYIHDFDGWHWLAARSDPLAQALDLHGNVQDREIKNKGFVKYQSRISKKDWLLKFTDNTEVQLHTDWDQLDRAYLLQPVTNTLYVRLQVDGIRNPPAYVEQVAAPANFPYPRDESKVFPQYSPVKLKGGAGEINAKGNWENGFWTVEFRRKLVTPAKELNDVVFRRLTQFSVHVFDHVEQVDQTSESKRLFLQFLPIGPKLVNN